MSSVILFLWGKCKWFADRIIVSSPVRKIVDIVIDNLPVPLHVPGYRYLGPGTKNLTVSPINCLDAAAKEHDLAYSTPTGNGRIFADRVLREKVKFIYRDTSKGYKQRFFAYLTDQIFKLKLYIQDKDYHNSK